VKIAIRLGVVAVMVLACVAAAVAQNPPAQAQHQRQQEQMQRQRMQNPERAAQMRAQIEARFGQRVQQELGLTDQQMERLRTAARANEDRMRDLNRRDEDMHRAVMDQLRPGVAANQDSLGRLLDGIAAARVQRAQSEQQEMRELGQFLNPVQRARLLMMRHQLAQRVNQIRAGGAPGMMPGMAPGGPGMPGMGGGMRPGMRPAAPDSVPVRPPEPSEPIDW